MIDTKERMLRQVQIQFLRLWSDKFTMKQNNKEIEKYRTKHPLWGLGEGNKGAFVVPYQSNKSTVIISDEGGWDHVSVSLKNRNPNWDEMCFIKNLFFEPEELAIQYHPPKSLYKNVHNHCLHLWRCQDYPHILPPIWMV
jgi:hypothetical protein